MMEKNDVNLQGEVDLKHGIKTPSRDVDIGEMLDVQSTPEEERKVLWKLDTVYVSVKAHIEI